jgi:pantothenate kinase
MEALFLEHEGYFGALGTFLSSAFGSESTDLF